MKIASILPYKENYTKQGAGAVALWISDFMRDSIYLYSSRFPVRIRVRRFEINLIHLHLNKLN